MLITLSFQKIQSSLYQSWQRFSIVQFIYFDASNPMWKIEKWKKDCEELHLRFHSVPEQGAFITDL